MKGRAIIPLVLGLGIGVFAIKMFVDVLKKARGSGGGETTEVICAKVDIAPTMEITEGMLEKVPVPKGLVPKQIFSNTKEVIGRVTTQTIPQGIPVVPSLLAPKGTPAGMAARIPDGYRAVAVKVDEVVGVAGWVKPGSRVDVVAVMNARRDAKNETISRVILQNVEVLAVGQNLGSSGEAAAEIAKSVTLLVKPEAVTKLHLAATKGTLRLAMRSQSDETPGLEGTASDSELFGADDTIVSHDNQGSSTTQGPSWLGGLLNKGPKPNRKATDKTGDANLPPPTPQVAMAGWSVEVMQGSNVVRYVFDGQGQDARRMDGGTSGAVAVDGIDGPGPGRGAHSAGPRPHSSIVVPAEPVD